MNNDDRLATLERTYMIIDVLLDAKSVQEKRGMCAFFRNNDGEYSKHIKRLFLKIDSISKNRYIETDTKSMVKICVTTSYSSLSCISPSYRI